MNAFYNFDELIRNFKGENLNYVGILIMSGVILLLLIGLIICARKWYSWKRDWYIDEAYYDDLAEKIDKRHNEELKQNERVIKSLIDNIETERANTRAWMLKYLDECDKLLKAENKSAWTTGKLKKINKQKLIMDYTIQMYRVTPSDFTGLHDEVKKLLKDLD